MIDRLIESKRLDVSGVQGKWESYVIQTIADPVPGVSQALVIAGSDKRGTIFGVYDLSENIGVSPWHWWADVPALHRDAIYVRTGRIIQGPPAVKYRGIFINDEAPAMSGWTKKKFGGFNSKMYTRVFELLLRLRANYLWPAMWGNAFNEDDPLNPKLADEYGIVMGTSHQEAMLRAQAEFDRRYKPAQWNYATHPDLMEQFWRQGVRRNKNYESLITIGMRGRDDTPMIEHATTQESMTLLEKIVARQRQILAEEINPDVTRVPQMWCLYKEVQGYYEQGLRVPDDVTLLWSDDNWGNLRRVPTEAERKRSGGAGIYYHFDYVGDPRNYKWLNTNPLPKVQEQLTHAFEHGADRVWIANVGDLKPMELPISFFMAMAWDPRAMSDDKVPAFTRDWAAQQFGVAHAEAAADVLAKVTEYDAWRKPELLEPGTFSLINYDEVERVETKWNELEKQAQSIYDALPPERRDAFFQLALYPVRASATANRLYLATARNRLFAAQGRASAADQAKLARAAFARDQQLTDAFNHDLADGKWDHMMDQTRIGYTGWQQPKENVMPRLAEISVPNTAALGVAVEGSPSSWPGDKEPARLPPFDTLGRQSRWIDIFRRGTEPFAVRITADAPWLKIDNTRDGPIDADRRVRVTIDWATVPVGIHEATVRISRTDVDAVDIRVHVVHDPAAARDAVGAFGSLTEAFAVPAAGATRNTAVDGVVWRVLPDYGRGDAGMAVYPVDAASVLPPAAAPTLEYPVYLPAAGDVRVDALIGPTLAMVPGRGLRLALSIDDAPAQVVDAAMTVMGRDRVWAEAVSNNVRTLAFNVKVTKPGRHTIKISMVDPGVVLEQLVVRSGELRPSYFGPAVRTWEHE